jgi:hypothetical protein
MGTVATDDVAPVEATACKLSCSDTSETVTVTVLDAQRSRVLLDAVHSAESGAVPVAPVPFGKSAVLDWLRHGGLDSDSLPHLLGVVQVRPHALCYECAPLYLTSSLRTCRCVVQASRRMLRYDSPRTWPELASAN